jgi:energy-coupling factor transporter ATP-binding protein EcfA2
MVGLTNQTADGSDVLTDVSERLEHEGSIGLVLGPPGSGKTALTLDIARTWAARTGGTLVGNTSWDGFDRVVASDRELLEAMASVEGPVLAVIDETAQELSGFGSGNIDAEEFSDSLTFVRKREESHGPHPKRGSVLMVNHTRTKTAKAFRDLCSFAVEKPSQNDPGRARLLDSDGGKDTFDEVKSYKGITDTRERYDEHEASEFHIYGTHESDEEEDAGPSAEEVAYRKDVQAALRRKIDGASHPEAAKVTDYSRGWVGDRWLEWIDGEHRDIVEMPENPPDHVVAKLEERR